MAKKFKIEAPCTENFFEMEDAEQGKFCEKCAKNVIDIRNQGSFEFTLTENTCVFARKSQLSAPFSIRQLASGVMIASSLYAVNSCTDKSEDKLLGEIVPTEMVKSESISIRGKISDEISKKTIANTSVSFVQLGNIIQTKTDSNGFFELKIPKEVVEEKNIIQIADEGYLTQTLFVKKKEMGKSMNVYLHSDTMEIGEAAPIEGVDGPLPPDGLSGMFYLNDKEVTEKEFNQFIETAKFKTKNYIYLQKKFAQYFAKKDSINEVMILEY